MRRPPDDCRHGHEQEPQARLTAYQAMADEFFDLFARLRAEAIIA